MTLPLPLQAIAMSADEYIPAFLAITPFGPYCRLCNNKSLSIQRGILTHGKECHPKDVFKNTVVVREVQRRMKVLQDLHCNDLTPFLTEKPSEHPTWFCNVCFSTFSKSCNYNRHLEVRSNVLCSGGTGGKMECYETICGRLGPKRCNTTTTPPTTTLTIVSETSSVSMLSDVSSHLHSFQKSLSVQSASKVPAPLLTTKEDACKILKPFARPDEDVQEHYHIYLPLLTHGFEGKMKEFLGYSTAQQGEDGILFNWLEAGREWFDKYADGHIANVSANVRSRLAEFEQRELDGAVVTGRTFALRRGIPRLIHELEAALRFFYRFPSTLFDRFKTSEVRNATRSWMIESAIIPKILFTAAAEEPTDHGKLPVACLYCLSRGFTLKEGCDLTMTECGWFASRVSAVLHLLRAGVCGYLVTLSGNTSDDLLTVQEMEIVGKIQNGRVTNLLAPYIKRLREAHARKPKNKSNTVNSSGDITSGSFTFLHSVWSTLIPRLQQIARACFELVFDGEGWKLFLEEPIQMVDWVQLDASVVGADKSVVRLADIIVQNDMESVIEKLQSLVQLCFYGLGVGSLRHNEVLRLTVLSCQWHNSYLYYWSESIKKGSLKASSTPKLVEHRLSLTLSRIVLLARYAMVVSCDVVPKEMLFSNFVGGSMLRLVQEIFDLDRAPQKLNVRHLFASIGNVIMPERSSMADDGCIVSTAMLTEKSGHTQMTGRHSYGTWLENSEEAMYDHYHHSLGEAIFDPPVVDFTPLSASVLKSSLKEMLGRKASYRSMEQECMVDIAANSVVRHSFIGLPCGQGKSLSWMVPTVASYLAGRHVGLRIVILPYKFLLGHVVQHAMSMLGLLSSKLTVSFLDSSQLSEDTFPDVLEGNNLPSLLFLNLDGAAILLRSHLARLQTLATANILKRVYLDEFQQLVVEYGFRSSYQSLQALGRIGVPVMCLSGSLPCSMAMSLMTYCGLNPTGLQDSIDVVTPTDPIGDGFSFDVTVVRDIGDAIFEYVMNARVGACHVLCSSISLVEQLFTRLTGKLKVISITGDSSYQEQVSCAGNWYKGGYDVLISTVVALVGNENRHCKTIIVGGFLFNVSSLVQAIGRLRPEQRGPSSVVKVFRSSIQGKVRQDSFEKGKESFDELLEVGCLKDDSRDYFLDLCSPVGLQQVLLMKEGCYLQKLSAFYGFARSPCLRCGLCIKSLRSVDRSSIVCPVVMDSIVVREFVTNLEEPTGTTSKSSTSSNVPTGDSGVDITEVADGSIGRSKRPAGQVLPCNPYKISRVDTDKVLESKNVSETDSKISKELCRKAEWVFSELSHRCLSCHRSVCNGECGKGCYRCGDIKHFTKTCSFDTKWLSRILVNKGVCFGCFDTRQHDMKDHDIKSCPLKKRLRRLIFIDRSRKDCSYEQYLRQLYSSQMTFVQMVASFSKETTLGR
jgi:hypothetical protein